MISRELDIFLGNLLGIIFLIVFLAFIFLSDPPPYPKYWLGRKTWAYKEWEERQRRTQKLREERKRKNDTI